jgi:hypothetical protein
MKKIGFVQLLSNFIPNVRLKQSANMHNLYVLLGIILFLPAEYMYMEYVTGPDYRLHEATSQRNGYNYQATL